MDIEMKCASLRRVELKCFVELREAMESFIADFKAEDPDAYSKFMKSLINSKHAVDYMPPACMNDPKYMVRFCELVLERLESEHI